MWRTLIPPDGAVIACAGDDVVGMAFYVDLLLTVPGGAVLPMAGVSWVCVAPTHRRRGVLRAMFVELHRRMAGEYPIAGLRGQSEAGIYSRFGYGPASVDEKLTIDRREARFHAEVPDPGGVRVVTPQNHRAQLEEIYERWRLQHTGRAVHPASDVGRGVHRSRGVRDGGSGCSVFCMPTVPLLPDARRR